MGQCLGVLSRRSKVHPLEVKGISGLRQENARRKVRNAEKIKDKGEESKLRTKENDENCHLNVESDIDVKPDGQDETNINKKTKEYSLKGNEENETDENAVKNPKDGRRDETTFIGDCSVTNSTGVIVVRSAAKEETLSFGSNDNIASAYDPSLPNLSKVSSSLINPKTTCMYRYQRLEGNCVGVVEEWDVEGLRCLTNTSFAPPSRGAGMDSQHFLAGLGLNYEQNMMESKDITCKFSKYNKSGKVAHLAVKKQLFGDIEEPLSRESQPRKNISLGITEDYDLAIDTKQGILTTNKAAINPIIGKPEHDTKVNMVEGQAEDLSSKDIKNEPYWTLREMPSWNKQPCLTYEPDKGDVKREMKNIDSEMAALLKPDEKNVKRTSIAFIIREGEKNRAQTPTGRAPQRLAIKQRTEVDQEKIKEKQKNAERRRNENIAKRIQSARRRSKQIEIPADGQEQREKAMERIGAAIARREEVLNQRVQIAHKSLQRKTDLMKIREKESSKVKEQVFEKVRGATERRNEIINQRVQAAMKACEQKKNTEEERQLEIHKSKERVFKKMEETTIRRNIILNQRVETVKKSNASRCDVVKERGVEIVDAKELDLNRKLKSSQHNRERMLRKTVRKQVELEKRRELVRKKLARMKREQEEEHLQFVELETYDGQSDDGENYW